MISTHWHAKHCAHGTTLFVPRGRSLKHLFFSSRSTTASEYTSPWSLYTHFVVEAVSTNNARSSGTFRFEKLLSVTNNNPRHQQTIAPIWPLPNTPSTQHTPEVCPPKARSSNFHTFRLAEPHHSFVGKVICDAETNAQLMETLVGGIIGVVLLIVSCAAFYFVRFYLRYKRAEREGLCLLFDTFFAAVRRSQNTFFLLSFAALQACVRCFRPSVYFVCKFEHLSNYRACIL